MTALVLDTRALEVVANPKADIQAARRMRDMLASAVRTGIPVRVPTAVLAEAYRGISACRRFPEPGLRSSAGPGGRVASAIGPGLANRRYPAMSPEPEGRVTQRGLGRL
jgi:hypothetical protein